MFKSVFAKYVTTFMALLLVSFLLLFLIVNSVFTNESLRAERRDLVGVTAACADNLAELYEEGSWDSIAALWKNPLSGAMIDRLLAAVLTNYEDMTVYVTDVRGGFIFSTGKAAESAPPSGTDLLGAGYFTAFETEATTEASATRLLPDLRRETESAAADMSGVFVENEWLLPVAPRIAYATPITASDGTCFGHVVVTSTAEASTHLMNTTLRSVAVAGLWIMLAALIAIYFTTERIIGPLREISRASKKLMVGQFDVRVRVHGKDEVGELAVAFNQMAGALENLDRLRNSFVANVSHDLRTPMTTISGFIDGILDGVIPPKDHAHYLHVVSDEVRRLSRLVTALLDVSRLQAGDRKFDKKPFDACEMGRQILISFEQKIDEKHLDVEFICEEERMFVLADRDAIHQILYNICDNAVKFSRQGGKLRMSLAWSERDGARPRRATVSVYNEGQGIPPEDIPFVFERFYKSDKSRSLDKTGVGLGMYIAKTIIDAHGETIWVTGEYGHDCTFAFTLTQSDPPPQKGRAGSKQE